MSTKIIITTLKPITEIKRVYSGKLGCMCGCNGNYFTDEKKH